MDTKRKLYRKLNRQMEEEFDAKIFVKHEFSEDYKSEKQKLKALVDNLNVNKAKRHTKMTRATIPAAAVIICTTSVFAASQLNKSDIVEKKVGNYQVDFTLYQDNSEAKLADESMEASVADDNGLAIQSAVVKDRYIKMNMRYIPDGLEELYSGGRYHGEYDGLTVRLFDMNDVDNQVQFEQYSVQSVEHFDINGNEAVLIQAHDALYDLLGEDTYYGGYHKSMYIYYKEAKAVVHLWTSTSFPDEELVKIAQNIEFTDGTPQDCTHFDTWNQLNPKSETSVIREYKNSIDKKYVNIYGVGDTFDTLASVELDNETGKLVKQYLSYKVKDISINDKLEEFGVTFYDDDKIKASLDENGNVLPDRLLYIKEGDGIFTLGDIVDDKTVNMKVVYVTMDVTNHSTEDCEDATLLLNLAGIREDADNYTLYDLSTGLALGEKSEEYDGFYHTSYLSKESAIYDDFTTYERKNHIDVKAGETKTIRLAYCVDESEIDHLYISPDIYGGQFEFRYAQPEENYQYIKVVQ